MISDIDQMRRALDLAIRGRGLVEPNPMVGCIISRDGRIIAEGYHRQYGREHAEAEALKACVESPRGATVHVTLEPCCHTNKKTPPCAAALIDAGISRVVVATIDPNPDVAGKGIERLRQAGVTVDAGILEPEARQLNAAFFARMLHRRPYVTLKWAQSADGKVAGPARQRVQISNQASTKAIHQLRARCDAIMVGIGTVLADDPMLTTRGVPEHRHLLRYVLDRRLRIPLDSQLVKTARQTPLLLATGPGPSPEQVLQLTSKGVTVFPAPRLDDLLDDMHIRDVTHLLVEPGPTLARAMFEQGLVDRVWTIDSPKPIGEGLAAPKVPESYAVSGNLELEGDRLTEYLNPGSPVFFCPSPSADLLLTSAQN